MNRYTIYCTPEQTKKALELGAPIEELVNHPLDKKICDKYHFLVIGEKCYNNPTTEQMLGWLEENTEVKRINIVRGIDEHYYWDIFTRKKIASSYSGYTDGDFSRKDATLAAIDAALGYLMNNKKRL